MTEYIIVHYDKVFKYQYNYCIHNILWIAISQTFIY